MADADRFEYRLSREAILISPIKNIGFGFITSSFEEERLIPSHSIIDINNMPVRGRGGTTISRLESRLWRTIATTRGLGIIGSLGQAPNGDFVVSTNALRVYRYNGTSWSAGIGFPSSITDDNDVTGITSTDETNFLLTSSTRMFTYDGTSWDDGVRPVDFLPGETTGIFRRLTRSPAGHLVTSGYRRVGTVWIKEDIYPANFPHFFIKTEQITDWISIGKDKKITVPDLAPNWWHKIEVRGVNAAGPGPISVNWAKTAAA